MINFVKNFFEVLTKETSKNDLKWNLKNSERSPLSSNDKNSIKSDIRRISKSNTTSVWNSSLVKENVNRIIHRNDLVDFYPDRPLPVGSNEIFREPPMREQEKHQQQSDDQDTDFDLINNSIENEDFYFADTTTTTTIESSIVDGVTSIMTSGTSETAIETSTVAVAEMTIETASITSLPTTLEVTGLSLNYTIPFHIPFEFNDSSPSPVDDVEEHRTITTTATTSNIEFRLDEIETPSPSTILTGIKHTNL